MTSTELRIGNLIWDAEKQRYGRVHRLNSGGMYPICYTLLDRPAIEHTPDRPGSIEGIPLTADILKGCGFVKDWEWLSLVVIEERMKMFWQEGKCFQVGYVDMPHIISVHQVQNLFHALTDKELQIQL